MYRERGNMKFDKFSGIAFVAGALLTGWGIGSFLESGSWSPAIYEIIIGGTMAVYGALNAKHKEVF